MKTTILGHLLYKNTFIKPYVQNAFRGATLHSPIGILVVGLLLQILDGLNQHLVLVCEVTHVRPQEIHFLLQE